MLLIPCLQASGNSHQLHTAHVRRTSSHHHFATAKQESSVMVLVKGSRGHMSVQIRLLQYARTVVSIFTHCTRFHASGAAGGGGRYLDHHWGSGPCPAEQRTGPAGGCSEEGARDCPSRNWQPPGCLPRQQQLLPCCSAKHHPCIILSVQHALELLYWF